MRKGTVILLVAGGVTLVFGFIFGIFFLLNTAMKGQAYELSLDNVRESSALQEQLGTPIEPGYLVMGSMHTSGGGSGHADISYTVHGPKGSADVFVIAERKLGSWSITEQVVDVENASERMPLVVDGVRQP